MAERECPKSLRLWWLALPLWGAAGAGLFLALPPLEEALKEARGGFLPDDAPSVQAERAWQADFGGTQRSTAVLIVRRAGGLRAEDEAFLDRITGLLEARMPEAGQRPAGDDWPTGVQSPSRKSRGWNPLLNDKLRSADGEAAVLRVRLPYDIVSIHTVNAVARPAHVPMPAGSKVRDMAGLVAEAGPPAGLEHHLTGDAGLGRDYAVAAHEGLDSTLLYTLVGIVAVLLFVYRSPAAMIISLSVVSIAVLLSFQVAGGIALLGVPVSATTKQFLIVLLYGCGTDFCLFLFARYREELAAAEASVGPADAGLRLAAMWRALQAAGPAIIASSLTVSLALGTMVAAHFQAYASAGPALASGVLLATAAALTLAPALMLLAGPVLFWPVRRVSGQGAFSGLWEKAAVLPGRWPVAAMGGVLLLFAPFVWIGAKSEAAFDSLQDLPPTASSRAGATLFEAHYEKGEGFPIRVLLQTEKSLLTEDRRAFPTRAVSEMLLLARLAGKKIDLPKMDGRMPTPGTADALGRVHAALLAMPTVQEVRSLTAPAGARDPDRVRRLLLREGKVSEADWAALPATARSAPQDITVAAAVRDHVGRDGRSTVLEVILRVPPYSTAAMDTVDRLPAVIGTAVEGTPLAGARVLSMGTTPTMQDIRAVAGSDLRRVAVLVGVALLLVLMALLADLPLSLGLIGATVAGYFATLGLAAVVGEHVLGLSGVDWKVEFFLFCILAAVGQDYNIFMVTRIMEESRAPDLAGLPRGSRATLAAKRAIVHTGGIISCCGVVMAVTFGSMMAAPLLVMKQIGFALAAGVMIDSFVIRPLLVPALYITLERIRGVVWGDGLPSAGPGPGAGTAGDSTAGTAAGPRVLPGGDPAVPAREPQSLETGLAGGSGRIR